MSNVISLKETTGALDAVDLVDNSRGKGLNDDDDNDNDGLSDLHVE